MKSTVQAAAAIARVWVRIYTARLPDGMRDSRRAEIDADVWEHRHDRLASGTTPGITAAEIVLRTFLGAFDDLAWRYEVLGSLRHGSNERRISMPRFTFRQTRWMGLAGVAGGLLWTFYLIALMLRTRADGIPAWGRVVPVVVAVLLLMGLTGVLTSHRERLGKRGTAGVVLLMTSMGAFLFANTVLAVLPPGAVRSAFGVVLAICFAIAPIPAFVLIGLALRGLARTGAFVIAVVGPLGMVLPSILASVGVADPSWLRPNSPVNLAYGIYFILAATWLAAAGYSTFRQASRTV